MTAKLPDRLTVTMRYGEAHLTCERTDCPVAAFDAAKPMRCQTCGATIIMTAGEPEPIAELLGA